MDKKYLEEGKQWEILCTPEGKPVFMCYQFADEPEPLARRTLHLTGSFNPDGSEFKGDLTTLKACKQEWSVLLISVIKLLWKRLLNFLRLSKSE